MTTPPAKRRKTETVTQKNQIPDFSIALNKLYEARAKEVSWMLSEFPGREGSKRAFQLLPRHLRRRAMSFNPHRVPTRLRVLAIKQNTRSGTPKKKKKRKYLTRKRRLNRKRDYKKRQRTKKWLHTHIWHAKRFHMIDIWGYRISRTPTDKGARAAYRASKNHTTIYDSSHTAPINIHGKQSQLSQIIQICTNSKVAIINKLILSGSKYGKTYLYQKRQDKLPKAVSPVQFMWRPLSESQNGNPDPLRDMWIFVHPAAFLEVHALFTETATGCGFLDVVVTPLPLKLCRFELVGPKAIQTLSSVLTEYQPSDDRMEKVFSVNSSIIPPGSVLGLTVQDPRVVPLIPPGYKKPQQKKNIKKTHQWTDFLLNWNSTWSQSLLWDISDATDEAPTGKFDSGLKIPEKEINAQKVPLEELLKAHTHVLLLQNPGVKIFGAGWTFICESSWAMTFWKSLVYAGARAIGLEEHEHLHYEAGIPPFPDCHPDTLSGQYHDLHMGESLALVHYQKPPAKRPNYEKLGFPSPFQIPWTELFSPSLPLEDIWVLRDNPQAYLSSNKLDPLPAGALLPVSLLVPEGGSTPKKMARIYHPDYDQVKTERVIGFVTWGSFSWRVGKCRAFGFCRADVLRELMERAKRDGEECYVGFRNVKSQWYHVGTVEVIEMF